MEPDMVGGVVGIVMFLLWLVIMLGMLGSWIIMIMAAWRAMKAHESIAQSIPQILQEIRRTRQPEPDTDKSPIN